MFHYIKGKVTGTFNGGIILENSGVGYEIFMPSSSAIYLAAPDETVTVYTYLAVREDGVSLFGFDDNESLEIFKMLTSVSGIGNKGAQSVLSVMSAAEIKKAVLFDDAGAFTRAPGIGKKTASRIILELKDKIEKISADIGAAAPAGRKKPEELVAFEDAVSALMALGYSRSEAAEAAEACGADASSAEEIIKASLKKLSHL
ncbi:MAG: Holliday junction branch migration protein RuvA [Anaerovoracaceae bacterium]